MAEDLGTNPSQESGGVQTVVSERATGSQFTIQSQYVTACDGARSAVRSYLNVESEGEDSCQLLIISPGNPLVD